MSKIEIGRWADQLRRMFGMAGVEKVAADLSPEISPVIVLEQPDPDTHFLKGLRQVFVGGTVAGAVGFNSKFRIRNPPDSGVIALIKQVVMVNGATSTLSIAVNQFTVNLDVVLDTTVPDPRWGALGFANPASTLVASSSNLQASRPGGEVLMEELVVTNGRVLFDTPFPLLPGVAIDMGHDATNITLRMWATWTERGFPELER